jgi:hypothetical protein
MGYQQSRWSLDALIEQCPWLELHTRSGMSRLLDRAAISYKRGRDYIHSPDAFYLQKLSIIELARLRAQYDRSNVVLLYQDEFSFYRQPTLAREYSSRGIIQPLALRSTQSNTCRRIVATLDAISGEVLYQQRSKIGLRPLTAFYDMVADHYAWASEIIIVQDNWPIHFHPDILAHLIEQDFAFEPVLPSNWPTEPRANVIRAHLPIRLLTLPTYASWLNPIEKLWRWLKNDVLHLHRLSDHWKTLQQRINDFLDQFSQPNQQLLRYVGLLPD